MSIDEIYMELDGATFTMSQTAKLLNLGVGRTELMLLLRELGLLLKSNEPCQRMVKKGYFIYRLKKIPVNGKSKEVPVTLVSIEGLAFLKKLIYKKLKSAHTSQQNNNLKTVTTK